MWQNLIKLIEAEKGKSWGAGFAVLENHKGVRQKVLHMNLKDPYPDVGLDPDPQQPLPLVPKDQEDANNLCASVYHWHAPFQDSKM